MMINVSLPIKTVSESNCSEHWAVKSKRHKMQQFFIRLAFHKVGMEVAPPCEITLIRVSKRLLDAEENLPMAFKWIKDELGACFFPEKVVNYMSHTNRLVQNKGHADSHAGITWKYKQEKGDSMGIRIEIVPKGGADERSA